MKIFFWNCDGRICREVELAYVAWWVPLHGSTVDQKSKLYKWILQGRNMWTQLECHVSRFQSLPAGRHTKAGQAKQLLLFIRANVHSKYTVQALWNNQAFRCIQTARLFSSHVPGYQANMANWLCYSETLIFTQLTKSLWRSRVLHAFCWACQTSRLTGQQMQFLEAICFKKKIK